MRYVLCKQLCVNYAAPLHKLLGAARRVHVCGRRVGHTPEQVQGMRDGLERLRLKGEAVIYDSSVHSGVPTATG